MKRLLAALTALAVTTTAWLSACSVSPTEVPTGDHATPSHTPLGAGDTVTPTATPGVPGAGMPDEACRAVELAREDLARRLGLPPEVIQLVSLEAVDWPDSSLGCPQPGIMYAQVITPGFLIVLEAKGQNCEYHTDEDGSVVLCQGDGSDVIPLMPVAPHGVPDKPMVRVQ